MDAKVRVKLEGEAEYKRALNNINQQNKTLNSELKKVKSSFNDNTTAQEKARKQTEVLTKQQTALKNNLALLQTQYDKVSKKQGENSTEALKLKDAMNKVEIKINKVNKELDDCAKELNNTGNKAEESASDVKKLDKSMDGLKSNTSDTSSKLKSFSNVLSKTVVAGCTAAITGIVKMIKQSVELYSATEQAVGGIQKLYGTDAVKVITNANNAFKTTGMSAVTYMENVTKYSAALINSLGGDTTKAAEKAQKIMEAIADNAATFGTDIETVMNAYQGFAKGTFTMLDSLNLGFGGSREGMQALLDKAKELSGIEFDISSFDDITTAIRIVQDEMNITGTVAKESAQTIQGSLDSMSAAWQNLLAGLADPNADIGLLVSNMMEAAGTAVNNLVPVIKQAIISIPEALKKAFPDSASTINSLTSSLQSVITIVEKLAPLLKTLSGSLMPIATGLLISTGITKGWTALGSVIGGVTGGVKAFGTQIRTVKTNMATAKVAVDDYKASIEAERVALMVVTQAEKEKAASDEKSKLAMDEAVRAKNRQVEACKKIYGFLTLESKTLETVTAALEKQKAALDAGRISQEQFNKSYANAKAVLKPFEDARKNVIKLEAEAKIANEKSMVSQIQASLASENAALAQEMQAKATNQATEAMKRQEAASNTIKTSLKSVGKTIIQGIPSIISAVTMIISVVNSVKQKYDEYLNKIRELTDEEKALKDASNEVADSIASQRDEVEKNRSSTDSELNYVQKLTSELTTLVDANGKVSEANKARVQFILTEMNSALGTEYTLTGNLIDGYGTLTGKVYELIEAKRREVYMTGAADKWKSAVQEQESVLENSKKSYAAYYAYLQSEDYGYVAKYNEYMDKVVEASNNGDEVTARFWHQHALLIKGKAEAAQEHASELYDTYRQDVASYKSYTTDIETYEAAFVAQQAGDNEAMIDILKNGITEKTEKYRQATNIEKEYTKTEIEEYKKRKENALNKYAELKREYEAASDTEKQLLEDKLQAALDEVTKSINPDIEAVLESGKQTGYALIDGVIVALDEGTTDIENATTDAVDNATDKAADNASTGGTKVAANCIGGVTSALLGDKSISNSLVSILSNAISNGEQTGNTSTSIATAIIGAITGPIGSSYLLLNCLKNAVKGAKDNASGVDTSSVGKNMISGIGTGITNNEWSLKKTFWGSVSNAITWVKTKLGIQSPSKMMRDVIGKNLMLGLAEGIKVGTSDVIKASSVAMGKIATSFETPLTQNVKLDTDSMNSALQYNIKVANQTKDMELAFKSAMNGMAVVMDGDRFGSFVSDTVLYGRQNVEGVY